jgi:hypothetical protein
VGFKLLANFVATGNSQSSKRLCGFILTLITGFQLLFKIYFIVKYIIQKLYKAGFYFSINTIKVTGIKELCLILEIQKPRLRELEIYSR